MSAVDVLDKVAPQFESEPADTKEFWLETASVSLSPDDYPSKIWPLAVALKAAHYMTLRDRGVKFKHVPGAPSGGITSVSDRSVSHSGETIDVDDPAEQALAATQYGAMLVGLGGGGEITTPILGG